MNKKSLFFCTLLVTHLQSASTPYAQELAADKAQHQSAWRNYAKSYGIDQAIQQSLYSLTQQLAEQMKLGHVSVRIAEANKTNNAIPINWDCTNVDNTYAIDLLGTCKSITIGEEFINNSSEEQIKAAVAHELAHIKCNHFTKRLILGLCCVGVTYYIFKGKTFMQALKCALLHIPIALALAACFESQEREADAISKQYLPS